MKFSVIISSYNQLETLQKKVLPAWNNQTFQDFEIVIADDGSSDGTWEHFALPNMMLNGKVQIKCVTQPDEGYRLVEILNKAAKVATGDYLVWVMGDSYPKEDFLENLAKVATPEKLLNGIRMNVDSEGRIISQDWRLDRVMFDYEGLDEVQIYHPRGWELMTLNTMCMPREAFERMGGIYPEYKGYGRMDWDMAAWCHFNSIKLFWVPKAVAYHIAHPEKEDTQANIDLFAERLESFKDHRTEEKMAVIMSQEKAEEKEVRIKTQIRRSEEEQRRNP